MTHSLKGRSDTILTIRSSDCHPNSNDYLIIVYKENGITYSRAFKTLGEYPLTPELPGFNWDTMYNALKSINTQEPAPSFSAKVIEGDTTWRRSWSFSGEMVLTFTLISNKDTTQWETVSSERYENPSMSKTKVSEYVLSETYNKAFGFNPIYGDLKYKKLPIISRRRYK